MKNKSNAKKELDLLRCASKIRPPKLNRKDTKSTLWWEQHLKLEQERELPDYRKLKCLQKIYTDKEIKDISSCGIKIEEDKSYRSESEEIIHHKRRNSSTVRKCKSSPPQPTQHSNPYMEFMNKSKKEARSWYKSSYPNLYELPITEQAEIIKTNIVKKFMKRFNAVTKSEEINEDTLMSMYEITCPFPVCNALNTKTEIYGSVPETTAKYLGCYKQSSHNKLIHQILRDIESSEKPPKKTAFGKNLPPELRRKSVKENPGAKWVEQNADHKSIETFAEVWKNITDLESTRRFCLYLLDHPNVTPPPFLVKERMLIRKILRKPVYLGNLEKQFENENTTDFMDIKNILQSINNTMADFNRRLTKTATSASSISVGQISDVKIMV